MEKPKNEAGVCMLIPLTRSAVGIKSSGNCVAGGGLGIGGGVKVVGL